MPAARHAYEPMCNKSNSAGVRMNLSSFHHIYVKNFPWELSSFGLRNRLTGKNNVGLISWESVWKPSQHFYVYPTPEATKSIATEHASASMYFRMPFGPPSSQLTTWIAPSWRFAPPLAYELAASLPSAVHSGGGRGFCLQGKAPDANGGHEEEHGHEQDSRHETNHDDHNGHESGHDNMYSNAHEDGHSHENEGESCASECVMLQPYEFTFYLPGNIPVWAVANTTGLPQNLPQDDMGRLVAFHILYWFLYSPCFLLLFVFSLAILALILVLMRRIALRCCIIPCCPSLLYRKVEEEVDLSRKKILSNGACQRLVQAWTLRSLGVLFFAHWVISIFFFMLDLVDSLFVYHAQVSPGPWIGTEGLGALLLMFAWLELVETVLLFVKKPSEHSSKHLAGLRGFWIDW